MRRFGKLARVRLRTMLWVIPILVLGYIGWMNLLPLGSTITYSIDVGGADTEGDARIAGPFDRISGKMMANGTSFRELEQELMYFELDSRRVGDADEVGVRVRFNGSFPEDTRFILGAKDKEEWSYYWKDIYVPFYEQLADLPLLAEDGNVTIYATDEESSVSFESVDEFRQNPPFGSVVMRDDEGLSINQMVSPQEWGKTGMGGFATGDVWATLLAGDVDDNGWLEADTGLRGRHTFYFFAHGDALELNITKRDLNWYEGEDMLDVLIYSLDGTLKAREIIADDGDSTTSGKLGDQQYLTLTVDNLERGVYQLVLKPTAGGSDLVITQLGLNQPKLVAIGRVFLGGNIYLGEEPNLMEVWYYNFEEAEIKFQTPHDLALQTITVSGEDYSQILNIDAINTSFSTGLLKPGVYRIISEKGDVIIEAPKGYFAFTKHSLFLPTSSLSPEENGYLVIDNILRGGHTFWTYVTNESLELEVAKQDLNWYEDPDELDIEVYSLDGELEGNAIIPDDGDGSKSYQVGLLQSERLTIQDLEPGAYRIEFKGNSDVLIRRIKINQEKLVVNKKIYLIGLNAAYFKDTGLPLDPVRLYFREFVGNEARFITYHDQGLQNISIAGSGLEREIEVNQIGEWFNATLEPGTYQLTAPKQDIVIEYDGYLSFTPDSFFLPKRCEVVDLSYDLSWARENADYIIVNYGDYIAPAEDHGWMVAQASWNMEDLFVRDNKLNFCFNAPHLSQTDGQQKPIPIDWIEICLKIPPIWERL